MVGVVPVKWNGWKWERCYQSAFISSLGLGDILNYILKVILLCGCNFFRFTGAVIPMLLWPFYTENRPPLYSYGGYNNWCRGHEPLQQSRPNIQKIHFDWLYLQMVSDARSHHEDISQVGFFLFFALHSHHALLSWQSNIPATQNVLHALCFAEVQVGSRRSTLFSFLLLGHWTFGF